MTIDEVQKFYQRFQCEVLTSSDKNQSEIQDFSSKIRKNSLEQYLKERAWESDSNGKTRVYLIREPKTKQIVMFFSLRCGLAFTMHILDDAYQDLNYLEKEFVQKIVDSRLKEPISYPNKYIESAKKIFPNNWTELLRISERRYETQKEAISIGDSKSVQKVEACYAAIELQHFCRADNYSLPPNIRFPLGFGLFWEKIVPRIIDITNMVGCEYFYLFAADRSDNPDDKKLISYYKDSLLFYELEEEGVILLKPEYDNKCIGLLQKAQYLLDSRNEAWNRYSDFIEK